MLARGTYLLFMGLLSCSVLVLSLPTVSSPNEDQLADLVGASDLVAVAEIVEVADDSSPHFGNSSLAAAGYSRVARLALLHVWKGEHLTEVSVPFTECLNPPAGPGYFEDERVVVFLKKGPEGWTTLDLAHVPADSTSDPLESLELDLLGRGPGATCLPGLPIQREGTIIP